MSKCNGMTIVKLSDFKINARYIAEAMWGSGGTRAQRTNRQGAYYYSCSQHGGYVVDGKALTFEEREKIDAWQGANYLMLLVQKLRGLDGVMDDYVIGIDYRNVTNIQMRQKRFQRFAWSIDTKWVKYPVYLFEEDIAWCVLELFTDVCTVYNIEKLPKEHRAECAWNTFDRWYLHREEQFRREEAPAA